MEEDSINPNELEILPVKLVQAALQKGIFDVIALDPGEQDGDMRSGKHGTKYALKNRKFNKDAVSVVNRAASLFVLYITAIAQDIARNKKRSTVYEADIIEALKAALFWEIEREMSSDMSTVNELLKIRKKQMVEQQSDDKNNQRIIDPAAFEDNVGIEQNEEYDGAAIDNYYNDEGNEIDEQYTNADGNVQEVELYMQGNTDEVTRYTEDTASNERDMEMRNAEDGGYEEAETQNPDGSSSDTDYRTNRQDTDSGNNYTDETITQEAYSHEGRTDIEMRTEYAYGPTQGESGSEVTEHATQLINDDPLLDQDMETGEDSITQIM
ncbi:CCAAT-binding transcription, putative [Babesia ovis]|uniref:CCAAT-binding transcription, putative n=1 Tax=Babesia ovis TaxID=5869 RepID=A0A9W5TAN9_BABOV|nr:CCAAT-binding transcription, putative [Babesia ovis]